jgi:hypothetical protein
VTDKGQTFTTSFIDFREVAADFIRKIVTDQGQTFTTPFIDFKELCDHLRFD